MKDKVTALFVLICAVFLWTLWTESNKERLQ